MAGYIGVDGKAQAVNALYVGVDGTARRVVKAYVGDENGKARLWFEVVRKKISFKVRNANGRVFPFEAYSGMTVKEWYLSDFVQKEYAVVVVNEGSASEPSVIKLTNNVNGDKFYLVCPLSFLFLERHDGVTFDTSFNEVTDS